MKIFGIEVEVVFLLQDDEILAYAWHYNREKALKLMKKIMEYHNLEGRVESSINREEWLRRRLEKVVLEGERFTLPKFNYKNRSVYEVLLDTKRGETLKYSELAKMSGLSFREVLITLMRNPFQILIPCHRLITNKGTLMGFYPLGVAFKKKLLELEGMRI